jgi:indole-3-glycerol phosphate synthase
MRHSQAEFSNYLKAARPTHYFAEVKKASPSKGTIVTDFPYLKIAKAYDQAGADAISVLTEPDYFNGHLHYLKDISQASVSSNASKRLHDRSLHDL